MRLFKMAKTALLLALAALAALALGTAALCDFEYSFGEETLDEVLGRFMEENKLTEDNFAMGWYDFASGQEWFFNENKFMVAGSIYKLPLNMVYTDKLAAGEIELTSRAGAYTVDSAMNSSIIYSSNVAAAALRNALNLNYHEYCLMLAQYSGLDESELPAEFFNDNRYSPRLVLNTLVYLYDNSELYSTLIERMKQAHAGRFFQSGDVGYEIAHKYGYYEGHLNDSAIVYSPRPFALVAFTRNVVNAEAYLGRLCEIMTDYSLYLDSLPEPTPEPTPEPAPEPTPEPTPEPEETSGPKPAEEVTLSTVVEGGGTEPVPSGAGRLWVYGAVCAVLLAVYAVRIILRRRTANKQK